MNLLEKWQEKQNKNSTVVEGLRRINAICMTKIGSSHFIEMKKGIKNTNQCFEWMVLNECVIDILEDFNIDCSHLTANQHIELVDSLTRPKRL